MFTDCFRFQTTILAYIEFFFFLVSFLHILARGNSPSSEIFSKVDFLRVSATAFTVSSETLSGFTSPKLRCVLIRVNEHINAKLTTIVPVKINDRNIHVNNILINHERENYQTELRNRISIFNNKISHKHAVHNSLNLFSSKNK